MAGRFQGSSVFITGASSGIGEALARAFALEGARLALAARRLERLESVRQELMPAAAEVLAVPCDVTSRPSLDAAVAQTAEAFGGIDVAVANAGFGVTGFFQDLSTADFRRQFETNVFGLLDTVYAVLPHVRASKGRLALISSVSGRVGSPASSPYVASKFAVTGLAESIYYDLRADGVSVTCIEPGFVESKIRMTDNAGRFHEDWNDPVPPWLVVPGPRGPGHCQRDLQAQTRSRHHRARQTRRLVGAAFPAHGPFHPAAGRAAHARQPARRPNTKETLKSRGAVTSNAQAGTVGPR